MDEKALQGVEDARQDGIKGAKESLEMKNLLEKKPTNPDSDEMVKWQGEMEKLKVKEKVLKAKEEEEAAKKGGSDRGIELRSGVAERQASRLVGQETDDTVTPHDRPRRPPAYVF